MEGGFADVSGSDAATQLSEFCLRLLKFLDRRSDEFGNREDAAAFRRAIGEFDQLHLPALEHELSLLDADGQLTPAGLTGDQLDFKLGFATRSMDEAGEAPQGWRRWFGSKRRWKQSSLDALGKVKVVLGSLKGLSKWVEALVELVEMTEKALGTSASVEQR